MAAPKGRILVGRFGAPQGVRGEIRIKSFTADPMSIAGYGPLTDETGTRAFEIERARPLKDDMIVARVKGLGDRDAARALTGLALYVAREELPPPDEDEFYIADLLGLTAVTPEGETLGTVKNVLNFGAGDILEISGASETLLAPFTRAHAPTLDFAARRIVVVRPVETE